MERSVVEAELEAQAVLRRPVDDLLFFAGEALAEGGEIGTVHGAILSDRRAAAEVLRGYGVVHRDSLA
jgi:hypothetical protein